MRRGAEPDECYAFGNGNAKDRLASDLATEVVRTSGGINKLDALTRILEAEAFTGMIIFVRTKTATVELSDKLAARGFASSPLNGDMSQQLRETTVDKLRKAGLENVFGLRGGINAWQQASLPLVTSKKTKKKK